MKDRFESAREYMENHVRPLERELFLVRFTQKPIDAALREIARYRNPDHGFGRGLEPDLRSPSSAALHTGQALFHLRDLGVDAAHTLIRDAIAYLVDTVDPEAWVWRPTPDDVNEHPHGPWWNEEGNKLSELFDRFVVIPRARIVSLLYHYAAAVPSVEWLDDLAKRTVASIEELADDRLWGGSLAYALEIADEPTVPVELRKRVANRILPILCSRVTLDEEKWSTYCTPPVLVAPRPDCVAATELRADVERNLDWLIGQQTERGCWEPNWVWGKAYPDAWEIARWEWCGVVTYETLSALRAYGRFAEEAEPV